MLILAGILSSFNSLVVEYEADTHIPEVVLDVCMQETLTKDY